MGPCYPILTISKTATDTETQTQTCWAIGTEPGWTLAFRSQTWGPPRSVWDRVENLTQKNWSGSWTPKYWTWNPNILGLHRFESGFETQNLARLKPRTWTRLVGFEGRLEQTRRDRVGPVSQPDAFTVPPLFTVQMTRYHYCLLWVKRMTLDERESRAL